MSASLTNFIQIFKSNNDLKVIIHCDSYVITHMANYQLIVK